MRPPAGPYSSPFNGSIKGMPEQPLMLLQRLVQLMRTLVDQLRCAPGPGRGPPPAAAAWRCPAGGATAHALIPAECRPLLAPAPINLATFHPHTTTTTTSRLHPSGRSA